MAMGIVSGLLSLIGCKKESETNQAMKTTGSVVLQSVPFETQLGTFRQLGLVTNSGVELSDIDRWGGSEAYEQEPYSLLYSTLGQTIEREPWTPISDKCWTFDTEAIEDHGSYVSIMQNLERLAHGEIRFEEPDDHVNLDVNTAWVSFTINGDSYKWDMVVNDDWVDPQIFTKVVELTKKYRTRGKYTYYNTAGQDVVIGYETPESLNKIVAATGLNIVWLH